MPETIHKVKAGETLWGIAEQYGIPVSERTAETWKKWGYEGDPTKLPIGFELKIPIPEPTTAGPEEVGIEKEEGKEQTVISSGEAKESISEDQEKLDEYTKEKIFPESPKPGEIIEIDGRKYAWNAGAGKWEYFSPAGGEPPMELLTPEEKEALGIKEEEEEEEDPEVQRLKNEISEIDDEIDTLKSDLDTIKTSITDASQDLINSIKDLFEARRNQMRDMNERTLAALRQYGIRIGTARYAPIVATGILSAEERAGIQRLKELDIEEAQLIAEAKLAANEKAWDLLHEKIELVEKKREEKIKELQKLQEEIIKKNEEEQERARKIAIQTTIADLYDQGITDPLTMLGYINFDEDGNRINDVTIDEIKDVLDIIEKSKKVETKIVEVEGRKKLINAQTGEEIKDLGAVTPDVESQLTDLPMPDGLTHKVLLDKNTGKIIQDYGPVGVTGLPEITDVVRLRNEFFDAPEVKDFIDINDKFAKITEAYKESQETKSLVAVDQALISTFNRITDPRSVVRESEYIRTSEDQSFFNRIKGKAQKVMRGGAALTDEERKAIVRMAKRFVDASRKNYERKKAEVEELAALYGIPPEYVTGKPIPEIELPFGIEGDFEAEFENLKEQYPDIFGETGFQTGEAGGQTQKTSPLTVTEIDEKLVQINYPFSPLP